MILQSTGSNLLAVILRDGRLQSFLSLNRTNFSQHELEIYDFINSYYIKYGSLPSLNLTCGKTQLQKIDEKDTFGYFYDEHIQNSVYNKMADILPSINGLLAKKKVDEALLKLKDLLIVSEGIKNAGNEEIIHLHDLGNDILNYIKEAREKEGLIGIPSGWPTLDKATGGFQKGEFYLMAARIKKGKSQLLQKMSDYAHLSGYIPLWVSMEMPKLQLGRRHYALRSGLNMNCLKSGMISSFAELKIKEAQETLKTQQPFYYIQGQFKKSIEEIEALVHGLKPDILYIDGGYLVKILRLKTNSKWEYMSEVAQAIKDLAANANIPVIATFQFNREYIKSKSKGAEHLQLSDALGQLASLVIGIQDTDPRESVDIITETIRHITALAGREGEDFEFNINFNFETMDFNERTE